MRFHGADRKATIVAGTNNEKLNGGTAKRALVAVDASAEVSFENLTIQNLTPQDGSQAEALRMQTCDRCSVRNADIVSLQDTLLWSGRVYARDCYIAGNVDFIWGTGTVYFEQCEIKTLGRKGYNVQARNGAGAYGYVFVDSKLTSDPGITGSLLGRVDSSVYPASHVAYIDCEMGSHIAPVGWQVTGGGTSQLRFWEYGSKTPDGAAVDVGQRLFGSKQLTSDQAAMMRDKSVVLGGWNPD
jgi:pectin methylesterase-like acyl-CoA thioesterase